MRLQDRVSKLEAARRADERARGVRFADFLEKHWAGACATHPELEATDLAFQRDIDATVALGMVPPWDFYPDESQTDRALLWALAQPGLSERMEKIYEIVCNYAAQEHGEIFSFED